MINIKIFDTEEGGSLLAEQTGRAVYAVVMEPEGAPDGVKATSALNGVVRSLDVELLANSLFHFIDILADGNDELKKQVLSRYLETVGSYLAEAAAEETSQMEDDADGEQG